MKNLIIMTLTASLMACAAPVSKSVVSSEILQNHRVVKESDFAKLAGKNWTGSLSYLDYSSGKMSSIPVGLNFDMPKGRKLKYAVIYPGETQYNATETIKISKDGLRINGHAVLSKSVETDGSLLITTKHQGKDNGKSAAIKTGYVIADNVFKITKDVKLAGSENYFRRNEYLFER